MKTCEYSLPGKLRASPVLLDLFHPIFYQATIIQKVSFSYSHNTTQQQNYIYSHH